MIKLIIDIGNTRAKLAIFDGLECIALQACNNQDLTELQELVDRYHPQKGILSSVIHLNETVQQQLHNTNIPILTLNGNTPLPLKDWESIPKSMGADRLCAIVEAANAAVGQELLVVDSGTCITYEYISAEGKYLGGNISPGADMRFKAMHEHTALLPLITSEGDVPQIGYDTATAMRSGVMLGIGREIEGYIRRLREKNPDILVFLTGGNILDFDIHIKSGIFADKLLLLKGLNRILDYNEHI